jgi:hypothetical protein
MKITFYCEEFDLSNQLYAKLEQENPGIARALLAHDPLIKLLFSFLR